MPKSGDTPSRGEITDRTDKSHEDMRDTKEKIDKTVCDFETIRGTIEGLQHGGTAEGADEVDAIIEGAEGQTVEVFEEQDRSLEELQQDSSDLQRDLQERSEADESDLGKLSDAGGRMTTDVAVNEFEKAKESAVRDIDFLEEQLKRNREEQEKSEREQQDYQQRVRARSGA